MTKNLLLGKLGTGASFEAAQLRGVIETANTVALMRLYGSRSEMLAAPASDVKRMRLYLAGEVMAAEEQRQEAEDAAKH